MYRFAGGGRLQEARAHASGEACAQFHDGYAINEEGKTIT
jgi:hypothetical protein